MKQFLKKLIGSDREKIVAVIGLTRDEVEFAVAHVCETETPLPVWAWCAEPGVEPVDGCDRFFAGATAKSFRSEIRNLWPALTLVPWTGRPGNAALKLSPLAIPPFRVSAYNDSYDVFPCASRLGIAHALRRLREKHANGSQRTRDLIRGSFGWLYSLLYRFSERAGDIFMLLLAALAGWSGPLARAIMRRHQGRPAEPFVVEPAPSSDFIEVHLPPRSWPRRRVLKAIRNSNAPFVVLRRVGDDSPAEPLVEAARRTNAFAVAKQICYAGWRKRILNKQPFRALQPGELSAVHAPFSSLIVIRRDVLARLTMPRAITFGAALMQIFWQSAARSLPGYVMGQEGPVTDELGMALEDAEFVIRMLCSSRLRRLAAARPESLRGNVAFSPANSGGRTEKPRILVVSPYLPFPLSHGGAVRIYNICRELAHEVDFVLACFREANEVVRYPELLAVFRDVYVVDADERHRDTKIPKQINEYRNSAMAGLIRRLTMAREVDAVQLEYTQTAEYRDHTGSVPVILVEHDITFSLYRQMAENSKTPIARIQYERWLDFERAALQCSNMVWTMSEDDRELAAEHGASRRSTFVVPNGVDLNRFRPEPRPEGPPRILFVGSFRHLPNILGFQELRQRVMPLVWQEVPDAVLHVIAGPNHERAAKSAGRKNLLAPDPRIIIDGFVEDVRSAYAAADVVAIPLIISAGTNLKVMESMGCQRAVVSTPVGCNGLGLHSGLDVVIAENMEQFAAQIIALLRDPAMRERIAAEGRRTAEERFGWDTIAQGALASYRELLGEAVTEPGRALTV